MLKQNLRAVLKVLVCTISWSQIASLILGTATAAPLEANSMGECFSHATHIAVVELAGVATLQDKKAKTLSINISRQYNFRGGRLPPNLVVGLGASYPEEFMSIFTGLRKIPPLLLFLNQNGPGDFEICGGPLLFRLQPIPEKILPLIEDQSLAGLIGLLATSDFVDDEFSASIVKGIRSQQLRLEVLTVLETLPDSTRKTIALNSITEEGRRQVNDSIRGPLKKWFRHFSIFLSQGEIVSLSELIGRRSTVHALDKLKALGIAEGCVVSSIGSPQMDGQLVAVVASFRCAIKSVNVLFRFKVGESGTIELIDVTPGDT
jgi:hypothetical protein